MANDSLAGSNVKDLIFNLLLKVIRDDSVLKPLFQTKMEKIDRTKAATNLENFLKCYYVLTILTRSKWEQFNFYGLGRGILQKWLTKVRIQGLANLLSKAQERSKALEERRMGVVNVQRLLNKLREKIEYVNPNTISDINEQPITTSLGNVELPDTQDLEWPELPEDLQKIKLFLSQGQLLQQLRISYRNLWTGCHHCAISIDSVEGSSDHPSSLSTISRLYKRPCSKSSNELVLKECRSKNIR